MLSTIQSLKTTFLSTMLKDLILEILWERRESNPSCKYPGDWLAEVNCKRTKQSSKHAPGLYVKKEWACTALLTTARFQSHLSQTVGYPISAFKKA